MDELVLAGAQLAQAGVGGHDVGVVDGLGAGGQDALDVNNGIGRNLLNLFDDLVVVVDDAVLGLDR